MFVCFIEHKNKYLMCVQSQQTTSSKVLTMPHQQVIFSKRASKNKTKLNLQSHPQELCKNEKTIVRLNTFILTKLQGQSINNVDNPYGSSYQLRGDTIRLGGVYICYLLMMKNWRLYFQVNHYIIMNQFWKETLKVVIIRVNVMKKYSH